MKTMKMQTIGNAMREALHDPNSRISERVRFFHAFAYLQKFHPEKYRIVIKDGHFWYFWRKAENFSQGPLWEQLMESPGQLTTQEALMMDGIEYFAHY